MSKKTVLEFNPDTMTVADLKKAAETLRLIIQKYQRNPDDIEGVWSSVAQHADGFKIAD